MQMGGWYNNGSKVQSRSKRVDAAGIKPANSRETHWLPAPDRTAAPPLTTPPPTDGNRGRWAETPSPNGVRSPGLLTRLVRKEVLCKDVLRSGGRGVKYVTVVLFLRKLNGPSDSDKMLLYICHEELQLPANRFSRWTTNRYAIHQDG